ncbi:MAG: excinuclease ABC subunit UvrA [Bacteroidales bacterium]|nr:excinuclease ABC subunit UvrA [Bacteroidales bacterium]
MNDSAFAEDALNITGARENNLKDVSVTIPQQKLVVITGLSGSGKSSLAFDTIYAEGQRRYMETFSAYARQFIGNLEHPDVDKITGLNPVISIEQKTVNKNPRSTVGTITEVYDFLRLLYARVADAYSYNTGEKMVHYSEKELIDLIISRYDGCYITILAPIVKRRKGHYRELFENLRKQGFTRVRIDGSMRKILLNMQVDRYKIHDIELAIDTLNVTSFSKTRLTNSVHLAMKYGKGAIMVMDNDKNEVKNYSKFLMCPTTGISYPEPEPNTFSFNSPYGACEHCSGLGIVAEVDLEKIIPDPSKSIKKGGIAAIGEYKNTLLFRELDALAAKYHFSLSDPISELSEQNLNMVLYGSPELLYVNREYSGLAPMKKSFEGVVNYIHNLNTDNIPTSLRKWINQFINMAPCPHCHGSRLKKESLHFRLAGKNIAELAAMDISELSEWINELPKHLTESQKTIATEILREISFRLRFLCDVGIQYLSLNRSSASLSGGEAQRIRLATQISSQLVNVMYILDEPSIGLHQRDNQLLIQSLKALRDIGNSVIVVEHDRDMMKAADFIVDIGPKAGEYGGQIVAQGSYADILKSKSLTADYLTGRKRIEVPRQRRVGNGQSLTLIGARGNNLKNVTVDFPLGKLICITGVSGSGKSTLINETLYPILNRYIYKSERKPLPYDDIVGLEHIDKIIEINQQPIGRTPRSNPVTYVGVFDDIRKLFSEMPESKIRGYKPGRFSFNVSGGRCETCKGAGVQTIEMNFLPDVYVTCEKCNGKRYNDETLEIRYKGKSINDVLEMDIEHAIPFFENIPNIVQPLKTMADVGLGYLRLGQSSTTLSGGEAQRVKLAAELSRKETGQTVYILDEPTTGLHFHDIAILMNVLNQLVDRGNTVIVIEHNMDVIKMADWIIDMGPEGGRNGGEVLAEGTPEDIVEQGVGYTAPFLAKELHHD